MKKPVMYILANKGLGMSPGKLAAQVAHAAVDAYDASSPEAIAAWKLGHHTTKIVFEVPNTEMMQSVKEYIFRRGFMVCPIIDEGRTEVDAFSFTALGVEIVDKADPHTAATFEHFKTWKDKPVKPGMSEEEVIELMAEEQEYGRKLGDHEGYVRGMTVGERKGFHKGLNTARSATWWNRLTKVF